MVQSQCVLIQFGHGAANALLRDTVTQETPTHPHGRTGGRGRRGHGGGPEKVLTVMETRDGYNVSCIIRFLAMTYK